MFSKDQNNPENDAYEALRKNKGAANVIIGSGVKIKGEISDADTVQIDGSADVTMTTENLMIGVNGDLKGDVIARNAEVWGKLDGNIKISGTLTIQEEGSVSGNVEYENLQVKLGGDITGDIKVSKKTGDKKPINYVEDDIIGGDANEDDPESDA